MLPKCLILPRISATVAPRIRNFGNPIDGESEARAGRWGEEDVEPPGSVPTQEVAMPGIHKKSAADTLLETNGRYLTLQLGNEPRAAEILVRWQTDMAKLEAADRAWKEAVAEQLRVRSQREWEQPKLRNALHGFSNRVRESRRGSRASMAYEVYFPNGLAPLTRAHLGKQMAVGRAILVALEAETDETILAAGAALRQALEAAEVIETSWNAAQVRVKERKAALDAAKVTWIAAYRRVEGELLALYSDERHMVGAFFLRRIRRKPEAEAPETAPAGAIGNGGVVGGGVPSGPTASGGWGNGNGGTAVAGSENGTSSNGGPPSEAAVPGAVATADEGTAGDDAVF